MTNEELVDLAGRFVDFWAEHRGSGSFGFREAEVRMNDGNPFSDEQKQILVAFFDDHVGRMGTVAGPVDKAVERPRWQF